MTRFMELFRRQTPPPPGDIYADDRSEVFPDVVRDCPRFKLWDPTDAVPSRGTHLLVGTATWSGYDMKLLDLLAQAAGGPAVIGVFDTNDCRSIEDFRRRIPGIELPYQTPVVGVWRDGRLEAAEWGYKGRQLAAQVCEVSEAELNAGMKSIYQHV